MQKYIKPELDLIELKGEDIIVTSPDAVNFNDNNGDEYEGGLIGGHDYDPGTGGGNI